MVTWWSMVDGKVLERTEHAKVVSGFAEYPYILRKVHHGAVVEFYRIWNFSLTILDTMRGQIYVHVHAYWYEFWTALFLIFLISSLFSDAHQTWYFVIELLLRWVAWDLRGLTQWMRRCRTMRSERRITHEDYAAIRVRSKVMVHQLGQTLKPWIFIWKHT